MPAGEGTWQFVFLQPLWADLFEHRVYIGDGEDRLSRGNSRHQRRATRDRPRSTTAAWAPRGCTIPTRSHPKRRSPPPHGPRPLLRPFEESGATIPAPAAAVRSTSGATGPDTSTPSGAADSTSHARTSQRERRWYSSVAAQIRYFPGHVALDHDAWVRVGLYMIAPMSRESVWT